MQRESNGTGGGWSRGGGRRGGGGGGWHGEGGSSASYTSASSHQSFEDQAKGNDTNGGGGGGRYRGGGGGRGRGRGRGRGGRRGGGGGGGSGGDRPRANFFIGVRLHGTNNDADVISSSTVPQKSVAQAMEAIQDTIRGMPGPCGSVMERYMTTLPKMHFTLIVLALSDPETAVPRCREVLKEFIANEAKRIAAGIEFDDEETEVEAAASTGAETMKHGFDIHVEGLGAFDKGSFVLWAGLEEQSHRRLVSFARRLHAHILDNDPQLLHTQDFDFTPHTTILKMRGNGPDRRNYSRDVLKQFGIQPILGAKHQQKRGNRNAQPQETPSDNVTNDTEEAATSDAVAAGSSPSTSASASNSESSKMSFGRHWVDRIELFSMPEVDADGCYACYGRFFLDGRHELVDRVARSFRS